MLDLYYFQHSKNHLTLNKKMATGSICRIKTINSKGTVNHFYKAYCTDVFCQCLLISLTLLRFLTFFTSLPQIEKIE